MRNTNFNDTDSFSFRFGQFLGQIFVFAIFGTLGLALYEFASGILTLNNARWMAAISYIGIVIILLALRDANVKEKIKR